MSTIGQHLLVALIVCYCAFGAFRQLAPRSVQHGIAAWRWQRRAQLSFWLEQRAALPWRRIGFWLRPPMPKTSSCGSGAGCNKCGSC